MPIELEFASIPQDTHILLLGTWAILMFMFYMASSELLLVMSAVVPSLIGVYGAQILLRDRLDIDAIPGANEAAILNAMIGTTVAIVGLILIWRHVQPTNSD